VLSSLQIDARLVTPPGMHEVQLRRFRCGQYGDSVPPTVVRTLRVDNAGPRGAARDAAVAAYLARGWRRNPHSPHESLIRGRDDVRMLDATESADTRTVTLMLSDSTIIC
jgi:hypothetical protein